MYRTRTSALRDTDVSRYRSPGVHSPQAAARSFYGELLGGREVFPTDGDAFASSLWFLVESQLVEVGAPHHDSESEETLELRVASPIGIAERCWDAGYTVRLDSAVAGRSIRVSDPFGRVITLAPRARARAASPAGESSRSDEEGSTTPAR